MVKNKERGGGPGLKIALALPPPPPQPPPSTNMIGWINDRELITLARPNKTPVLQAKVHTS